MTFGGREAWAPQHIARGKRDRLQRVQSRDRAKQAGFHCTVLSTRLLPP